MISQDNHTPPKKKNTMEGSNKNRLQEYFQKTQNGRLPTYSHHADLLGWVSTLTLPDRCGEFIAIGRTKKEADQIAAGQALQELDLIEETIEQRQLVQKHDFRLPGCLLVLIDLENSPGFERSQWLNVIWDCCRVEAFVGKLSSHATKDLRALYPFVDKFHIVDSGHRDAVDHAISVRAGQWLETFKHPKYYIEGEVGCLFDDAIFIVSRDRFAPALVDVLRQQLRSGNWKTQEAIHSINIDECFEILDKKRSEGHLLTGTNHTSNGRSEPLSQ